MQDTHSEEYRHQCEIRWFIRHSAERDGNGKHYLAMVAAERGQPAADALRAAAADQWGKGNRGDKGDWKR